MKIIQNSCYLSALIVSAIASCEKKSASPIVTYQTTIIVCPDTSLSNESLKFSKPSYYRSLQYAIISLIENAGDPEDVVIGDSLRVRDPLEINALDDKKLINIIRSFFVGRKNRIDILKKLGWVHILDSKTLDVSIPNSKLIVNNSYQTFTYYEYGNGSDHIIFLSPYVKDMYGVYKSLDSDRILVGLCAEKE